MGEDLRDKLRRLGVHRGASHLREAEPPKRAGRLRYDVQAVLAGRDIETASGPAFIVEQCYELSHLHGGELLGRALDLPGEILALLAGEPAWQDLDLRRAAFIDTETTGLAGGTGTLAFLVGVGQFQDSPAAFHLAQFFLRQPGEEAAMLTALDQMLAACNAIVSFNGRGFDVPLLQTRFTLNRMFPSILAAPHLDLLAPARRLWRDRLPSCALASLEEHVLNVRRDQADVPGCLIPQMYFDYLQTGNASEMPRVLYHNAQDILSMVTLVTRLGRTFAAPPADATIHPVDLVSLARWHDGAGRSSQAEAFLRSALQQPLPREIETVAWRRLALLLKRQERHAQAAQAWERLAALSADVTAHVELAKHYEWRARDTDAALRWTLAAIKQVEAWQPGPARADALEALLHRKQRLERKEAAPDRLAQTRKRM